MKTILAKHLISELFTLGFLFMLASTQYVFLGVDLLMTSQLISFITELSTIIIIYNNFLIIIIIIIIIAIIIINIIIITCHHRC